ncbi:MAG: DUF2326 domain-containing protein [Candidatus Gottesmanbacteria bacterium]|nr:DUF2326 domain-containing protein [Candidatus Gottesmanbacteria bacterium]
MIKLLKLYSVPNIFDPIEFHEGVNLVIGEKVEERYVVTRKDRKTNGVGKSMCIEFINYCLLKQSSDSRVTKIPLDIVSADTVINLDLIVGTTQLTIRRSVGDSEKPTIINNNGNQNTFNNVDDANKYLTKLLYEDVEIKQSAIRPSFRQLIGPLIRDEDSEFKDVIHCYDLNRRIPASELIKPHLFFFDVDLMIIDRIKEVFAEMDKKTIFVNKLKRDLTVNKTRKLSEVKAEANAINSDLQKINGALESFKTNEAYESIQNDLAQIETELNTLRSEQAALKFQIRRIDLLPGLEEVRLKDIELIYNQFREGLGDIVGKSLTQVVDFKKKISEFQATLLNEKVKEMRARLDEVTEQVRMLEDKVSEKMRVIDKKGVLKDFKNAVAVYNQKNNEFFRLQGRLDDYEKAVREQNQLKLQRDEYFSQLDAELFKINATVKSFNDTIIVIHEYIMGSASASFGLNLSRTKDIIEVDYRIDDDGSHSVDRTKVFIYDLALILNHYTSKRHPKFLIHDNIFDVDQDTLVQSINYAYEQESRHNFQYILTLNRDKIENEERKKQIKMGINEHVIARFTRQSKFLKKDYREI